MDLIIPWLKQPEPDPIDIDTPEGRARLNMTMQEALIQDQVKKAQGGDYGLLKFLGGVSEPGETLTQYTNRTLLDPRVKERGSLLPWVRRDSGHVEFGAPEVAVDLAKAFGAFGHAAQGGTVTPEEAAMVSLDLAGGGLLSSRAPGAVPKGNVLGIFAGPSAKTADKKALSLAKQLAEKGASRDEIWRDTGWFKDVDGAWKFEIDDSGAKAIVTAPKNKSRIDFAKDYYELTGHPPEKFATGQLPEVDKQALKWADLQMSGNPVPVSQPVAGHLQHPDLYDAYDFSETTAVRAPGMRELRGSFDPSMDEITYGGGIIGRYGDDKSTLLHELQHAVQHREGFAKGGSPGQMVVTPGFGSRANMEKSFASIREALESGKSSAQITDLQGTYTVWGKDKLGELDKRLFNDLSADNFTRYKRLAGEAEARNVQKRMDYTPAQRQAKPPWTTLDVPEDELIVRKDYSGPMEATVWHGSPHKFDKFDLSKIGTGEGNQMYGHGLYMADQAGTARHYMHMDDKTLLVDGVPLRESGVSGDAVNLGQLMVVTGKSYDDLAADIGSQVERYNRWFDSHPNVPAAKTRLDKARSDLAALNELKGKSLQIADPGGNLYKVDLPDEAIERMLDWDKPLSEQPEGVRRALAHLASADSDKIMSRVKDSGFSDGFSLMREGDKYYAQADNAMFRDSGLFDSEAGALEWLRKMVDQYSGGDPSGSHIYSVLAKEYGGDNIGAGQISAQLREAGIPGIKYLDQGSRASGKGTHNYVVFDDKLPKILERNGQPIPWLDEPKGGQ